TFVEKFFPSTNRMPDELACTNDSQFAAEYLTPCPQCALTWWCEEHANQARSMHQCKEIALAFACEKLSVKLSHRPDLIVPPFLDKAYFKKNQAQIGGGSPGFR